MNYLCVVDRTVPARHRILKNEKNFCSKSLFICTTHEYKKTYSMEQQSFDQVVAQLSAQWGCEPSKVTRLIELTSSLETRGARFARLNEYRSDKSDSTESASHTVLLNFSYENMLKDEKEKLLNFDVSKVDVNAHDYSSINTGLLTLDQYKQAVKDALPKALAEINAPKQTKGVSNDVWLNKVMVFNLNTLRLSIVGEAVKKSVVEEGEFKQVKSAPLTVAKQLIKKQANCRSEKYRRFAIDNFEGALKLQGETLEIGG